MTREVAKSMEFDFSYYSTFGWQPLNVEAALANVKYIVRNKERLLKNANEMGNYFEQRLQKMRYRYPAIIRRKGLAIGVEFKKDGYATTIVSRCRKNKLLFSDLGPNVFTLFPALNIDRETAEKGLNIIEKVI